MRTLIVAVLWLTAAVLPNKAMLSDEKPLKRPKADMCEDNGECSEHAKCVPTRSGAVCVCEAGFTGNGLVCEPKVRGEACSRSKMARVQKRWKDIIEEFDEAQKTSMFQRIIDIIAEQDEVVATQLKQAYLSVSSDSMSESAEQFFDDWHILLITISDSERLRGFLQFEAERRSHWARSFLADAPLIADSVVAAFDGQLSTIGQKLASASCLGAIADKIKNIANRLTVSAICEVDIASGLPEYPIHGRIKFTQPLLGGPTKIQLRLTGFDGTNKHGFYVHQVGSTEDKCRASGEQNNPQDKANGGLDDERYVRNLGDIQADAKGRVVGARVDQVISLFGENNIIGRVADIRETVHKDEDDLGQGGAPDSKTSGNAGPRMACCLIEPFVKPDE